MTMITVIGESLVDTIRDPQMAAPTQTHPGGSPLNVAVGCARRGPTRPPLPNWVP